MYFDMDAAEVRSFQLSFFRFSWLEGPARYVRFSDSGRGDAGRLGRFWMHGSDIAALLREPGSGFDLIRRVSDGWAICDDWGDKQVMWILTIPTGGRVPAAVGKAAFQPVVSQKALKAQRDTGRPSRTASGAEVTWLESRDSYAGQGLQYVVPVVDDNRVENPALVGLIGRRLSTYTVAADPDLFLTSR